MMIEIIPNLLLIQRGWVTAWLVCQHRPNSPITMVSQRSTFRPSRIVCFTEETVEMRYLLGEQARIIGISRYPYVVCVRYRHDRRNFE